MRTSNRSAYEKSDSLLWEQLLPRLERNGRTLQSQLRASLVGAILNGSLRAGSRLPSSRELATMLDVARNTVVLTLEQLVYDGYLESRPRSGYYVANRDDDKFRPDAARMRDADAPYRGIDWGARLLEPHYESKWLNKDPRWQQYRFPLLYGQFDPKSFPVAEWRECSRLALSVGEIHAWAPDAVEQDDPALVEQLIRRVLPRRGISAKPSEILLTVGAQHALFMLSDVLISPGTPIGFEEPGYMDARNIFARRMAKIVPISLDDHGMEVDARLDGCQYVYCTPSHHCPSGITMSTERRLELLQRAEQHDLILIEDDYDAETQYEGQPLPALKALDKTDRVIYVGSVSKIISPGLRIGYIVGNERLIAALRRLRRLMIRHPSANNQRTLALFIAQGHYDNLITHNRKALAERASCLSDALATHWPELKFRRPSGGSVIWAGLPPAVDANRLVREAREKSVLTEAGDPFFHHNRQNGRYIRLGFASIALSDIDEGVRTLAQVAQNQVSRAPG